VVVPSVVHLLPSKVEVQVQTDESRLQDDDEYVYI
jgi:hypothetical protein